MKDTIIYHFRDNRKPYATMIAKKVEGNWQVGFAVCSPKDQFNYRSGRTLAGHRAITGGRKVSVPTPYLQPMIEGYATIVEKMAEHGVELPEVEFTTRPVRAYPYLGTLSEQSKENPWDYLEVLFVSEGCGYVTGTNMDEHDFNNFSNKWDETQFSCTLDIGNLEIIRSAG